MARKKQFNTRYSPEFKISVILDMRENGLGYNETARKYWVKCTPKSLGFFIIISYYSIFLPFAVSSGRLTT